MAGLEFSWWLSGKEPVCNAGDMGLIPGSGRSPGEGNDNPLQYSSLGNPMDRGAWRVTDHVDARELDIGFSGGASGKVPAC